MEEEAPRRLYRSNNGMIAGVCGGIADYFGWDPTLVRVGYILYQVGTELIKTKVRIPERYFSSPTF